MAVKGTHAYMNEEQPHTSLTIGQVVAAQLKIDLQGVSPHDNQLAS